MARKTKYDLAKEKAAKQKKIAIGGAVLLVALLAYQGPKTLKMLHRQSAQPVAAATTTTPTVTPSDPNTLVAPTLGTSGAVTTPTSTTSSDLVSAVPVSVDPGQLRTFEHFAAKDPFAVHAPTAGPVPASGGKSGGSTPPKTVTTPTTPAQAAPPPPPGGSGGGSAAPTTAVLSLNGELMSVQVDTDFPTSGATFTRSGALFHLVSLTSSSARIAVAGGSYADGAATVTLKLRVPVTLQNTADGSKYTLILEPQGTTVPTAPTTTTPATAAAPAAATTTTPATAVPSGNG